MVNLSELCFRCAPITGRCCSTCRGMSVNGSCAVLSLMPIPLSSLRSVLKGTSANQRKQFCRICRIFSGNLLGWIVELHCCLYLFMLDVTLTHHIPAIWTCEIGDMEIYQNVHNRRDIDLCQNDKQPQITLVPKFITWINLAFSLRIISLCLM